MIPLSPTHFNIGKKEQKKIFNWKLGSHWPHTHRAHTDARWRMFIVRFSPKRSITSSHTHTRTHARTHAVVSRFVQTKVCVEQFALKHFFPFSGCSELGNLHNIQQQKNKDYKANIFVGLPPRIFLRLIFASEKQKQHWNGFALSIVKLNSNKCQYLFEKWTTEKTFFSFTFFCFLFLKTWINTFDHFIYKRIQKVS